MKYYCHLYISDTLAEKKEEILDKLEHDKFQFNKYLIVFAQNPKEQLEFYQTSLLLQKIYKKEELFIVGIADGFEGALELIEQITQEVYEHTKGADIRSYLQDRQKEFEEKSR